MYEFSTFWYALINNYVFVSPSLVAMGKVHLDYGSIPKGDIFVATIFANFSMWMPHFQLCFAFSF
jgi:hypothetical protein